MNCKKLEQSIWYLFINSTFIYDKWCHSIKHISGDDNDKIRKFHNFIVLDENFIFFTRQRNPAQSTDLGEYYEKTRLLFEIEPVVLKIQAPEVEEKSKISKISHKFSQIFNRKWWFCVHQNHRKYEFSKFDHTIPSVLLRTIVPFLVCVFLRNASDD